MMRQVTIPGLAPTTNHLYPSGKDGRRHLSADGRDWQQTVCDACVGARLQAFVQPAKVRLSVSIDFCGLTYRRDVDGAIKATLDALGMALSFDDRYIDQLFAYRRPLRSSSPETKVSIMEIGEP